MSLAPQGADSPRASQLITAGHLLTTALMFNVNASMSLIHGANFSTLKKNGSMVVWRQMVIAACVSE